MKHYLRVFLILCLVLIGITVLSACGGNDDPDDTTAPTTTAPVTTTAPSTAPVTTTAAVTTVSPTEGLVYYPLPDGTYAVSAGNARYLEEIIIPNTHNGKAVTAIVENGFKNLAALKKIVLSDNIKTISEEAFYGCSSLTSLNIPSNLQSIGRWAFGYCKGLASVTIPPTVKSIDACAFEHCSALKSVYISDLAAWCEITFADITANPLFHAENLYLDGRLVTELVIPNGVESIGKYSFDSYSALTSVTIAPSVKSIGKSAFSGCTSINSLNIPSSVEIIDDYAFSSCTSLKSVKLPSSLTNISKLMFAGCESLTSVIIPSSVTSIEMWAFQDCTALTSIVIPSSVKNIDIGILYGCNSLESITVPFVGKTEDDTSWYMSIGYFFNLIAASYQGPIYDNKEVPKSLKTVIITGGKSLSEESFVDCKYLKTVHIPASITYIGAFAFNGCDALENVFFESATGWNWPENIISNPQRAAETLKHSGSAWLRN